MRRRALLAAIAAGSTTLAGCSMVGGSDDPTATDDADTPNSSPRNTTPDDTTTDDATDEPDEGSRSDGPDGPASLIDLETVPRTYSLVPTHFHTDDEASVSLWFDRTATADHPARVRGYLENDNPFENTFRIEWIPVVGRVLGRQPQGYDHEARLHFAPTENNELATTVPEVRRDEDGLWQVADVGPWMAETHRTDAGERVELEYVLVGEANSPGRPTGTYEFRGDGETVSVHVWDTDAPGPSGASDSSDASDQSGTPESPDESRFAGLSVPEFVGDTTTGWYHEADPSTQVYVAPETERTTLDAAVQFELVHHGREPVGCGHWNLHKLVDGEWYHVAPNGHNADCRQLRPGERIEWTLRAFNGEAVECGSCGGVGGCRNGLARGYLGGGRYAVVAGYGSPHDDSAALVDLKGDPVDIVPTDDATSERDGDTAVVTTDRFGDDERPEDGTLALTRTDAADERILAEQVMGSGSFASRSGILRNALAAMADDVERVVVRTDRYGVDAAVGHDADVRRFRFRGQAYEASRDE